MSSALIIVSGIVQGVGFRPFVHGLINEMALPGWVQNTVDGVHIAVPAKNAEALKQQLLERAPKLAKIHQIRVESFKGVLPFPFEIRESGGGDAQTGVAPDAALCDECAGELGDALDRRHGYAFLNCTNCGPRFSIIQAVPYDRANTTMSKFAVCDTCAAEFSSIDDRRYHAQPTACPSCGPQLWFKDDTGEYRDKPVSRAVDLIKQGKILALRGVGGFHLSCLASDESAVTTLRQRKNRPSKPFAVMVRDIEMARKFAGLSSKEEQLLLSAAAPIVLATVAPSAELAPSLLCGLNTIGIMLAYSPLHRLLLAHFDRPLVMTSGNRGSAPQVTGNDEALAELAGIADAFLLHNREIENRVDDSLVQSTSLGLQVLRRARGLAPAPIPLPGGFQGHPDAIAFGADLKNAFALAKGEQAIVSQHIGDLSDFKTAQDLTRNITLLENLFDVRPELVVCDMHPGYHSTRLAKQYAVDNNLPLISVQHHHAHAASQMAENNLGAEAHILALVQDGLGMGHNGDIWGAEALQVSYGSATRIATLSPAAMPGGDAAATQPWRNLVARLHARYGSTENWPQNYQRMLARFPVSTICAAIESDINSPLASSAGRLFDAIAATLGIMTESQSFEGEAAMHLQELAQSWINEHGLPEPYVLTVISGDPAIVNPDPIWDALGADLNHGGSGLAAARFHVGWAEAWAQVVKSQNGGKTVALTGGVFQNRLLVRLLSDNLKSAGFNVLTYGSIPPNDGGIALGQLVVGMSAHQNNMGTV